MSTAPIRNDFQREKVMETILQTIESKRDINALIRGSTRNKLRRLHPNFHRTWRGVTGATAARQNLVQTRDELVSELDMFVRHFRNCLNWRAERMDHGRMIMRLYLPMGDMRPNPTVPRDVVKLAEFLVEGEEIATAQGYPPMTNPTAAELAERIQPAKSAVLAVETADLDHMEAQEDLRVYRAEADILLRTIAREIQIELSDKPAGHVRRILRRLGYSFTTAVETPVVEEETPEQSEPQAVNAAQDLTEPEPTGVIHRADPVMPKDNQHAATKGGAPLIRGRPLDKTYPKISNSKKNLGNSKPNMLERLATRWRRS
ncbi:MAG: hypothetical protein QNK37_38480 [Acidobacteriota bacterium]|nr:hypothetical protein [Acidobacteriota bacterium]